MKLPIFVMIGLCLACGTPAPERIPTAVSLPDPTQDEIDLLCRDKTAVEGGRFSVSSGSYPCEIVRTYEALEATEGRGFLLGSVPRFFLKVRLVTRGIFSSIFGMVGLG